MTNPMTNTILLRNVVESDLPIFFEQQLDPVASGVSEFLQRASHARGEGV
jgi:hypothetical protein